MKSAGTHTFCDREAKHLRSGSETAGEECLGCKIPLRDMAAQSVRGSGGGGDRTSSELARRAAASDAFTRASVSATAVSFAARSTTYRKSRSHSAQLEFSKPAPVRSSQPMKRSGQSFVRACERDDDGGGRGGAFAVVDRVRAPPPERALAAEQTDVANNPQPDGATPRPSAPRRGARADSPRPSAPSPERALATRQTDVADPQKRAD